MARIHYPTASLGLGKAVAATVALLSCALQLQADELIVPTLSITAPADSRAVVGSAATIAFTLQNNEAVDSTFDLAVTAGSGTFGTLTKAGTSAPAPASPWAGASLAGSQSGTLTVEANLSGLIAGQSTTLGVDATRSDWTAPATASSQIQVVG